MTLAPPPLVDLLLVFSCACNFAASAASLSTAPLFLFFFGGGVISSSSSSSGDTDVEVDRFGSFLICPFALAGVGLAFGITAVVEASLLKLSKRSRMRDFMGSCKMHQLLLFIY